MILDQITGLWDERARAADARQRPTGSERTVDVSGRDESATMLTLYRSGRQADALHAYQRVRRLLGDELGIEPGASLRRLDAAILAHDPALDWALERSAPSVVRPLLVRTTGNLPPATRRG